jgi:hypothetical protein
MKHVTLEADKPLSPEQFVSAIAILSDKVSSTLKDIDDADLTLLMDVQEHISERITREHRKRTRSPEWTQAIAPGGLIDTSLREIEPLRRRVVAFLGEGTASWPRRKISVLIRPETWGSLTLKDTLAYSRPTHGIRTVEQATRILKESLVCLEFDVTADRPFPEDLSHIAYHGLKKLENGSVSPEVAAFVDSCYSPLYPRLIDDLARRLLRLRDDLADFAYKDGVIWEDMDDMANKIQADFDADAPDEDLP